jgi:trans-aconitate methyltransferase
MTRSRLFPAACREAGAVDAWTTEYLHVLPLERGTACNPVVGWIKGTTLTPYLAALPDGAAMRSVHRRTFRQSASPLLSSPGG